MTINFDRLEEFPAYKDVLFTESELLSTSITSTTWQLAEAYYRRMAASSPNVKIVSFAETLSYAEAADEIARKSETGERLVRAYKGLLNRIKEVLEG